MKKVHVKLNKILAVMLSVLMCLSLPGNHALAETADQDAVTEGALSDGGANGAEDVPETVLPVGTTGTEDAAGENGEQSAPEVALQDDAEVSAPEDSGESGVPVVQAAGDADLFSYVGATATEGVLEMTRKDYEGKTGALEVPKANYNNYDKAIFPNEQVTETVINAGTVVLDVEFCPMGAAQESVVFANSKGDILFVVSVDSEKSNKFYLADTANAIAGTEIGTYNGNCWSRIKAELDLDAFAQGKLQFKVSVTSTANNGKYTGEWSSVGSVTQEDLKTDNGTVTAAIDGSAEHPYDLGSVRLTHKSNKNSRLRYFGDIHLYKESNVAISKVELSGELPVQTCGTAFNPGDAALVVTDVNGDTVTKKLSEMVYDVDYTVSGYTAETGEADSVPITITYKGVELSAAVAVKNVITGIQIKSLPNKTVYDLDESLDQEGLVVEAVMSDKSTRELLESEYEVSALDASASGYHRDITVTYNENKSFTASFKVKVEDSRLKNPVFAYTGNEENLAALGFEGDTDKAGLNSTDVNGNATQHITFTGAGVLKKTWDALETGTVKVNVEFNQVDTQFLDFRLYDKIGNPLFDFVQRGNNGNVNLLKEVCKDTSASIPAEKVLEGKKQQWIRLETTIDLGASNAEGKLKFITNAYYKNSYEKDWTYGGSVTSDKYVDEWGLADGCLTAGLTEFSIGAVEIEAHAAGPVFDNIEVLIQGEAPVVEAKVTGIKIKSNPTTTTYNIGQTFDKTGLEVEAEMSDGTTKPLAVDACEVSAPDMTTAGTKTVTVTYKEGEKTFEKTFNIKVTDPNQQPSASQSFLYIDEDNIDGLEFDVNAGYTWSVVSDAVGSNETNKIKVNTQNSSTNSTYVTKTLGKPISTGKVTLQTVSNHNEKILGIKIVNSEGKALVNYSQQTSGNLNMYKGDEITGGGNTVTLAGKDDVKNKWIKVETTIDLDESNRLGVLQFEMNVSYKKNYTDEEWIEIKTYTQNNTYVNVTSNASANGSATGGLTSFDVGGIQIGASSDAYVDDILFDDGNGIEGYVTIKSKELKSIAITTEPTKKEFVQDARINTEGMVLTGTYKVIYSDDTVDENKEFKIVKYDVECDTSKVADSVPVTIKVTDNGREFTATYNVRITEKPDGSYVTFSYTDESGVVETGFDGSKISVAGGDVSGNKSNKIKVDKGTSTMTLAEPRTTGTVHFETEFLTTSTSKASLFLRILNSENKPMVDIAQYGSGNLNLYIDKNTEGTDGKMAGQFGGLPVKQWAKLSVDIDLEATREQGHLMFDAIVWKKADYSSDKWTVHAEYNQDLYLKSATAPTTTGSASSDATVFDVAAIELVTSNGTSYYDNMFFEAVRDDVTRELLDLEIASPADKTEYIVGDGLNRAGLVLTGTYKFTLPKGDVKTRTAEITKYDISFDNTQPGESVPVTLSAGGHEVVYYVKVLPNTALNDIEQYLVDYVDNILVNLGAEKVIYINKRQMRLPAEAENGEKLSWEVISGDAAVKENVLTVNPSTEKTTEISLKVTLSTKNNDGDPVSVSKTVKAEVSRQREKAPDTKPSEEESLRNAISMLYERGLFDGQADLKNVDAVMANLDREIRVEEIAVILVNMFDIDTTYTRARVSRKDVEDNAWYSKYVRAAFQLSVETRDSHEGKENYGIGKGISKDNLLYMIDRIVHVDQTTLPSDYAEKMFE